MGGLSHAPPASANLYRAFRLRPNDAVYGPLMTATFSVTHDVGASSFLRQLNGSMGVTTQLWKYVVVVDADYAEINNGTSSRVAEYCSVPIRHLLIAIVHRGTIVRPRPPFDDKPHARRRTGSRKPGQMVPVPSSSITVLLPGFLLFRSQGF